MADLTFVYFSFSVIRSRKTAVWGQKCICLVLNVVVIFLNGHYELYIWENLKVLRPFSLQYVSSERFWGTLLWDNFWSKKSFLSFLKIWIYCRKFGRNTIKSPIITWLQTSHNLNISDFLCMYGINSCNHSVHKTFLLLYYTFYHIVT